MRVTHKSVYIPFQRNLEDIQARRMQEQIRLSTGEDIVSLSDNPNKLVDVKMLSNKIELNSAYKNSIEEALSEMLIVERSLEGISATIATMRQLAIDSTHTGNTGGLNSLATYVRGVLDDVVREANTDFNGKYVFSGTMTTAQVFAEMQGSNSKAPFEIIEGEKTPDNPSGLQVIFKGNLKDREIHKDGKSSERININAQELFGAGGEEFFQVIVDMYNLMAYDKQGEPRSDMSTFKVEDIAEIDRLQKRLADFNDLVNQAGGINGTRFARLEQISFILREENLHLNEFRSFKNDTDITRSTINLKTEETALQYALNVGSRIMQISLFDFMR